MHPAMLLIPILLPIIGGALTALPVFRRQRILYVYSGAVAFLTAACSWALILFLNEDAYDLISFTDRLVFRLRFDKLGRFFAGISSTLWPLAVIYAFSYMRKDERKQTFFVYYLISFGVALGIAMAGNLFTLYCYYELLTLTTVPLVMHTKTREAVRAARSYFWVSIGGAAFAFISIVFLIVGGKETESPAVIRFFYLLGFFGFGVKSAVFPLHFWLPRASVAPTPVTALLHAVAVVKAGIFSLIRLTYDGYGTAILQGSFAQYIALGFVLFTILYGSVMAVREPHFKRRLAYSSVSNLSYVLFGALLMTKDGLSAGLLHMAFHSNMKILSFFAAGAVLTMTGREYLEELNGLGKRMPVTFACYLISALALTGIPPFCGFVSKWSLLSAAISCGTLPALIGAGILVFAAFLSAIYMLTPARRAFFPDKNADLTGIETVRETDALMTVPMLILAVGTLATGLLAGPILNAVSGIAAGLLP